MSSTHAEQIVEAADLLHRTLRKLIISEHGAHAETLVAAGGRMAGTMLFHSFSFEPDRLRPGTVFLSDEADEQGPGLLRLMFATLGQLGHQGLDAQVAVGRAERSALSRLSLAETQQLFEPWYRKVQALCGLSSRETADAAAIATAMVIHDCRSALAVEAGCAVAVDGVVESVKTVPQRVAAAS
jgi:hypothetical protein